MVQAELDTELRMGSDGGEGLLCAVSHLQKIVSDLVCQLLDDQVGVGLELAPLVPIERNVREEPANRGQESH